MLAVAQAEKAAGYKMTTDEKVQIIKDRIKSLEIHVPVLENDILHSPNLDHPDKTPRFIVLQEINKALHNLRELERSLTNQG
jgi:hypothetical protein